MRIRSRKTSGLDGSMPILQPVVDAAPWKIQEAPSPMFQAPADRTSMRSRTAVRRNT